MSGAIDLMDGGAVIEVQVQTYVIRDRTITLEGEVICLDFVETVLGCWGTSMISLSTTIQNDEPGLVERLVQMAEGR